MELTQEQRTVFIEKYKRYSISYRFAEEFSSFLTTGNPRGIEELIKSCTETLQQELQKRIEEKYPVLSLLAKEENTLRSQGSSYKFSRLIFPSKYPRIRKNIKFTAPYDISPLLSKEISEKIQNSAYGTSHGVIECLEESGIISKSDEKLTAVLEDTERILDTVLRKYDLWYYRLYNLKTYRQVLELTSEDKFIEFYQTFNSDKLSSFDFGARTLEEDLKMINLLFK